MRKWRAQALAQEIHHTLERKLDGEKPLIGSAHENWPEPLNQSLPYFFAELAKLEAEIANIDIEQPSQDLSTATHFEHLSHKVQAQLQAYRQLHDGAMAWLDKIEQGEYEQASQLAHVDGASSLWQKLHKVADKLARLEAENEQIIGMSRLTESLLTKIRGIVDVDKLGKVLLDQLIAIFNAYAGACYIVQDELLTRIASHALPKEAEQYQAFKVGEGIVGETARQKTYRLVNDIPTHHLSITSGLVKGKPGHVLVWPIIYLGTTIAVIELASFFPYDEHLLKWLEKQNETLGIAFSVAFASEKVEKLLAESEQKNEELKTQQEELRAQSEALQKLNAELEEKNTELMRFQAELEERNELLERQKKTLDEKQAALERANRYKSEFLANMSHELRTPLNSLLLLTTDLLDNEHNNLTQDQLEALSFIKKGGEDLLNLINDILDLSKIEAGQLRVIREPVRPKEQLKELVRFMEPQAKKKGLQLIFDIGEDVPPTIFSDGQRIAQIVKNLLSNAIKFTTEGKVTLRLRNIQEPTALGNDKTVSDGIVIEVEDTGPGIPQERLKEVFEAFQQGDGSITRQHGGTGLGLTISRELARRLGGDIRVQSVVGEGTTFSVILPMDGLKGREKVDDVTERPSSQNSDASFQPMTDAGSDDIPVKPTSNPLHDDRDKWSEENRGILIIEDDEAFAQTLASKIRARGLNVLISGNGTDGIGLAYHYRPIGIVLDMGLPDMDGSEVVRTLKQYQRTRMIPVHIVSARDVDPELFKLGVTEYIQKPLTSERLNKLLEELETFNETPIGRLLVIEDDETARVALKTVLSKKGMEVSFASNQNQALELVRSEVFDAYIIDLGLPDGDGLQLAKEVAERNPTAPVIIYTGEELSTERYEAVMETNPKVVLKGVHGTKRLLDEVELFVHKLKATTSVAIDKGAPLELSEDDVLTDKKVLVVDDDMRNAFALTRVLKKMGMRVVLANDGQLALNKLDEQNDIDIVLMDIMMPVMDGYEAMRRIRSHPRYREVPIIALTAKAMADDRKKCIDAGASDYLSKPIDIDKLKTLMKLYLSS